MNTETLKKIAIATQNEDAIEAANEADVDADYLYDVIGNRLADMGDAEIAAVAERAGIDLAEFLEEFGFEAA